MKFKRVFLIVLDSLGVGAADDARDFNDEGSNTFGHILENNKNNYPNLEKSGLLNIVNNTDFKTDSYYSKAKPKANGKDTLTGHLELMGIRTLKPFKTFTDTGFPKALIDELEKKCGRKVIGNISASGTEIIEKLGKEHMETGSIIVYTSADSVLQIAAHEEVVKIDELYKICEIARELTLKDEWKVGRIIARPFIGTPGNFVRTYNRHDYALDPASDTVLDKLKSNHYDVISIGKISDIFNGCGITKSIKTKDNFDGILKILNAIDSDFNGLCFVNLNDFDSKYGHRRDVDGYANAIKEFDLFLPKIKEYLRKDDLLIITADHGNDPSFRGTDHTRENIPVLIYSKKFNEVAKIEDLECFSDIGETILDIFGIESLNVGKSFKNKLK